ncbi:MAG TPA: hypothetical protein VGE93_25315 [Bryobacteraceae bacterium]
MTELTSIQAALCSPESATLVAHSPFDGLVVYVNQHGLTDGPGIFAADGTRLVRRLAAQSILAVRWMSPDTILVELARGRSRMLKHGRLGMNSAIWSGLLIARCGTWWIQLERTQLWCAAERGRNRLQSIPTGPGSNPIRTELLRWRASPTF